MRAMILVTVVAVAGGCGDNRSGVDSPDADPGDDDCLPRPPIEGDLLADPAALTLPDGCIAGGIAGVVGRWFVSSEDYTTIWGHPRFEQACGRTRLHHDPEWSRSTNLTFDTWSDDTRVFLRQGVTDRLASGLLVCAVSGGGIGVVQVHQFRDPQTGVDEPDYTPLVAQPFGLKDEPVAGLTPVGSLATRADGSAIEAYNLVVEDGLAYVAGPGGLDVIDVHDPAQPTALGHLDGFTNDVRIAHGGGRVIAYLGDSTTRLIDVTTPSAPTPIGALGVFSHSLQIATRGGERDLYAVPGGEPSVPVFDISDPVVPVLAGTIVAGTTFEEAVHDLSVDGTMVYADATVAGAIAFDATTGFDDAVEVGRFTSDPPAYNHGSWPATAGGRSILLTSEEGGLGTTEGMGFVRVLDADRTSPGFMTQIGRYQSRREVGVHYFIMVGERAYLANFEDGVRVLDLADPTAPIELAHANTWNDDGAGFGLTGAFSVRVVDDLIYVADSTAGLIILRDPALTQ